MLLSIDPDSMGQVIAVNAAIVELTGRRPDELRALDHADRVALLGDSREAGERHAALLRELASGAIASYCESLRIVHADGHALWLQVDASLVRDSAQTPVCALLHIADTTERELVTTGLEARRAVAQALSQAETVEGALAALPGTAGKALGAELGVAWAYEAADGRLHARASWQAPESQPGPPGAGSFVTASRATAMPLGAGLPGRAWAMRECLASDRLPADDPRAAVAEEAGIRAVAAIPIAHDEELVGVLELASCRPSPKAELTMPILRDLAGEARRLIGTVWGAERRLPSRELLLVEDNMFIARLVREMLASSYEEPLDLFHAKTLAEASDRLASTRPACVLLDLNLPDAAGLTTLTEIRARAPEVPVVVLTGEEDEKLAIGAVKAGAQDYLMKRKVDMHGLARSIRYAIERKGVEQDLLSSRLRHSLTQLPTRVLFLDQLRVALSTNAVGEVAVVVVDLDRFRMVNNSLGHELGDRLLVDFAERLQAEAGDGTAVASLGGDTFALLVTGPDAELTAVGLAGRIVSGLERPFQLGDQNVVLSGTAGVALNRGDTLSAEDLLSDADVAMSRAKDAGGAHWEVFEEGVRESLRRRLTVESELRAAIENEELSLHYQPIVALGDRRLLAFEALVRWEHPERGTVPPGEFIPLAEHAGLIGALGSWVMKAACRQLRSWRSCSGAFDEVKMHVNLAAAQIRDTCLVSEVASVLSDEGLTPGDLCLEVTETSVIEDFERSIETLEALRGLGVHIALDDFGTGYSSLAYVSRLPVDSIKLDRSFLIAGREQRESAVVALVGGLARSLGLPAIAEGIESADDIGRLRDLGYERGQGYWLGIPEPPDAALELITNDGVWEVAK